MTAAIVSDSVREAAAPEPLGLLLSQEQAWTYLGLSRPGWYRLRSQKKLPNPVSVPGTGLRWRRADLDEWVKSLRPDRKVRRSPRAPTQ